MPKINLIAFSWVFGHKFNLFESGFSQQQNAIQKLNYTVGLIKYDKMES